MREKAEHHRECAERSRRVAQDIKDEDAEAHLLDVARQYDNLAAEAEPEEGRQNRSTRAGPLREDDLNHDSHEDRHGERRCADLKRVRSQ